MQFGHTAVKNRPLEDEIHARLRQLTTEVRALREDLEGTLKRPPKRPTRVLIAQSAVAANGKLPREKNQKRRK
jgi:hypothetical protein